MTFEELQQIVESNARSIQALSDRIAEVANDIAALTEMGRQAQEERQELRQVTIEIGNLFVALDEDRPTILRKLNSIEGKFDRLLG